MFCCLPLSNSDSSLGQVRLIFVLVVQLQERDRRGMTGRGVRTIVCRCFLIWYGEKDRERGRVLVKVPI